jgi:ABC-type transporter Mla MlaB component
MSDPFELPAELNIYSALETRDALLAWVTEHASKGQDTLNVSAKNVEEVDGSGLQLLAALANMEHAWQLVDPSDALVDACRTMGLSQWLDQRVLKSGSGG